VGLWIASAELLDDGVLADARRARDDEYSWPAERPQISDDVVGVFTQVVAGTGRGA
jgi:hypothetical protein